MTTDRITAEMHALGADANRRGKPRVPPSYLNPRRAAEWLAGWDAAHKETT